MIQTPAILESHKSLKDGTIKLVFETQDISAYGESIGQILSGVGQYGMLGFKLGEKPLSEDEISHLGSVLSLPNPKQVSKDKSPSNKLRNALFVYFSKSMIDGDFERFYEQSIETFRQKVLSQIPED